MVIGYGKSTSLLVRYFSIEVLQEINHYLTTLARQGGPKHEIAQYKQLRNILQRIEAVTASDVGGGGVLRKIDLSDKNRAEITNIIRNYIAQSSRRPDVYGVYKVELAFPGKILRNLNNVRFVDLFGFGEPSPLINMKYTRFTSEEPIDAVVYVFPNRAVTEDFYQLFEIPRFLEEIVARKHFFIVLNKADTYIGVSPFHWKRVADTFRKDLVRHVPILKRYAESIPIFVLSAASIDGKIAHKNHQAVRNASLTSIHSLRDQLRSLSEQLEQASSDPSIYLSSIFDLLDILDLLAVGAEETLERIESRLPEIARLVDSISFKQATFDEQKIAVLEAFRISLQREVERHLRAIDYENIVRLVPSGIDYGDPRALFRWMVNNSQQSVRNVYKKSLAKIIEELGEFIDQHLLAAYREYVSIQDDSIQAEFEELLFKPLIWLRPLGTTVEFSAKNLLRLSQTTNLHYTGQELIARFAGWFLRSQCEFDAERGQTFAEVYSQVLGNVQKTVEVFMKVFVCEEPRLKSSYISHICTAGEPTYWQHVQNHISKLDEVLADQVQITKWKFGLYQNKVFFVSHKDEFTQYVKELLSKKDFTQTLVLELT